MKCQSQNTYKEVYLTHKLGDSWAMCMLMVKEGSCMEGKHVIMGAEGRMALGLLGGSCQITGPDSRSSSL